MKVQIMNVYERNGTKCFYEVKCEMFYGEPLHEWKHSLFVLYNLYKDSYF